MAGDTTTCILDYVGIPSEGRVDRERGGHGLRIVCAISERDNIAKSFIPRLRFSHPLIEPNVPY